MKMKWYWGGHLFKITGNAADKLRGIIAHEKRLEEEVLFIRLSMGIGWGGPKLNLSLEEQILNNDQLYEFDGLKILIHQKDFVYFDHTKLDYIVDVFGKAQYQLLKI